MTLIPLFDQAFESWLFNAEGTYVYLNPFFKKELLHNSYAFDSSEEN